MRAIPHRKMRKVWTCLVIIAILVSLCACSAAQRPSGTVTVNEQSGSDSPHGTVTENSKPEETAKQSENEAALSAGDAGADAEESGDAEFEFGTTSSGTYENRFLGIGCTLDENWTFASEDEIKSMNAELVDQSDSETLKEALSSAAELTDMYAIADDGLLTIGIMLENIGVLYGMTMDEDTFVDKQLSGLADAINQIDIFSDYSVEKSTVMLAGQERTAIRGHGLRMFEGMDEGFEFYQVQAVIKAGNYMAVITLTSFIEDVTDSLASYFYALN